MASTVRIKKEDVIAIFSLCDEKAQALAKRLEGENKLVVLGEKRVSLVYTGEDNQSYVSELSAAALKNRLNGKLFPYI